MFKSKKTPFDASTPTGAVAVGFTIQRNNLTTSNAPIGLTYSNSPYVFTIGLPIAIITPAVTGTVTSCTVLVQGCQLV